MSKRSLKKAVIALAVYAAIITIALVVVLVVNKKGEAGKSNDRTTVAETTESASPDPDKSEKELTLEQQAEYNALCAAQLISNIDDYHQYVADKDRAEAYANKLQIIQPVAADNLSEISFEDIDYKAGKTWISSWCTEDGSWNIVVKNDYDTAEYVYLHLVPTEDKDSTDAMTDAILFAKSGLYEGQYPIRVSLELMQNKEELQKKVVSLLK